jgi:NTP pyrophosphatase (non-canonical NTP hydrolase)
VKREGVTSENYVDLAVRTDVEDYQPILARLVNKSTLRLMHSLMGLQTEVGELADILKRHLFYGTPIDWQHVKEEYGDCSWYLGLGIDVMNQEHGCTMEEVLGDNIRKLEKRYPEKFSEADALKRADKHEPTS